MTTLDIAQAEKAADESWDEMMEALTPEQRNKAMAAALIAFDGSLNEQGCWLPDVFARAAQLERRPRRMARPDRGLCRPVRPARPQPTDALRSRRMTPKAPPQIWLDVRPDGSFGLVDEAGKPIADGKRYSTTAADMAKTWAYYAQVGINVGRKVGTKATAEAAAAVVKATAIAYARAGVDAGVKVGANAGAKAGVEAGARYGAQHVLENSRVRRRIERDSEGRITGSIEARVFEHPNPPAAEKGKP